MWASAFLCHIFALIIILIHIYIYINSKSFFFVFSRFLCETMVASDPNNGNRRAIMVCRRFSYVENIPLHGSFTLRTIQNFFVNFFSFSLFLALSLLHATGNSSR